MKNNIKEVVFILDKSGSMSGFEQDTMGGFNSAIRERRKLEGTVYVTTVLFNSNYEIIHDRLPVTEVPEMTAGEYSVGGCTALLDAIGTAIRHIETVHRYIRPEDVPDQTLFLITTDGLENASRQFSSDEVKAMIRQKTEENGWEFVFLAANIDAVETAKGLGIREERAVNFKQSSRGIKACFKAAKFLVCDASSDSFKTGKWREELDRQNREKDA